MKSIVTLLFLFVFCSTGRAMPLESEFRISNQTIRAAILKFTPDLQIFQNKFYVTQMAVAKNLEIFNQNMIRDSYAQLNSNKIKPRVDLVSTVQFNTLVDLSPVFGVSITY